MAGEGIDSGRLAPELADPLPEGLYRAAPCATYPVDRRHTLLVSPASDDVQFIRSAMATALAACHVPRTLDDHIRWLSARLPAEVPASRVESTVRRLLAAGVLVPCMPKAAARQSTGITTVAVMAMTGGRQLEQCLRSYLAHLREQGREPAVMVFEAAPRGGLSNRSRAVCGAIEGEYGTRVAFVGEDERRRFLEALVREGMLRETVERAIGMPESATRGAALNTMLLLTRGQRILCVGDDTVATPWALPSRQPELALGGHVDPYRYDFYEDRGDALPPAEWVARDLLDEHQACLGRSITELVSAFEGRCDSAGACSHLLARLAEGPAEGRVRVAVSGVAGDVGVWCPYSWLVGGGDARRQMAASEDTCERALEYREARRAVERVVLTHDALAPLHCASLDNVELIPPVLPAATVEDEFLEAILPAVDPWAVFAHVPAGIVRDSALPAAREAAEVASAARVRVTEVVSALLRVNPPSGMDRTLAPRLERAGRHLAEVAALDGRELAAHVRDRALRRRSTELRAMDTQAASPDCPAHWKGSFAKYRLSFLTAIEEPTWYWPAQWRREADVEASARAAQRDVAAYAALLQEWPALCAAAERAAVATGAGCAA